MDTKKGSDYSLPLCDSGGIQTHNLLIRSQMLYSVELRNRQLALISEMRCKGTHFLRNHQNFSLFFLNKRRKKSFSSLKTDSFRLTFITIGSIITKNTINP